MSSRFKRIGVVGCGTMGAGIASLILSKEYEVVVREVNREVLENGVERIKAILVGKVKREGIKKSDAGVMFQGLEGTVSLAPLKDCDLIIEAITEDMDEKVELFRALDSLCNEDAVLASNTSSLSITRLASSVKRRDRVLGIHFFQPAYKMPLVEIVRTFLLKVEILNDVLGFVRTLGKVPIVAKDQAGFIVNLLLTPFLLDAMRAVSNGVASVQDIDTGMKLGLGHPMGPLMLADFVGLDVILNASRAMYAEYRDDKYAPPPVLVRMVQAGWLGQKTRRGFYDWSDPQHPVPRSF